MKVGFVICPNCGNEVPVTSEGVCEICHEDLSAFAPPSETYEKLTPLETWIKALTAPSEKTFKQIVNQPSATIGRAALWIFFAWLIPSVIYLIYGLITSTEPLATDAITLLFDFILKSISVSVIYLLFFLTIVGVVYLFSRLFGGKGPYGKLLYGFAAFQAPLSVMITVLPFLTVLSGVSFFEDVNQIIVTIVGLYSYLLLVITNKVVNKFGWGKAILCTLTPIILFNSLLNYVVIEASEVLKNL